MPPSPLSQLNTFTLFGALHLLIIALLFILVSWITLSRSQKIINLQRLLVGGGLVAHIIIFHSYYLLIGQYDLARFLPFHLCSLSAILIAISLLTRNKKISTIAVYWAPVAALLAILLPDMASNQSLFSFRFLEFFVSHILIAAGSFWLLCNQNLKFNWQTSLQSYLFLVGTLPPIYLINRWVDGNYMYMMNTPSGGQMNFLPTEPYHFLGLMVLVLLVFLGEMVAFGWLGRLRGGDTNSLDLVKN